MIPSLFESTTVPVLEQVVNFTQARHHTLASNLANMDTPGYRAVDLSQSKFEARLKEAIRQRDRAPLAHRAGSSGGAPPTAARPSHGKAFEDVRYKIDSILYHDDSKVALEHTVAEMAKNQSRHNTALAIMTSQFRLLQTAISERV